MKMGEKEEIEELVFGYGNRDSNKGVSDFDIHALGTDSGGILGLVDGAVKDRTTSELPINANRATGCTPTGYNAQVLHEADVQPAGVELTW